MRTSSRTALQTSLWARHSPLTLYRTEVGYFNASRRRLLLQKSRLRRLAGACTKTDLDRKPQHPGQDTQARATPATPCRCTASRDVGDGSISTELGSPRHVRFPPKATELRTWRDGRFVPATEVAERSFFHFTAHQNALQFAEAKLKNGIYARYFAKIAVCKQKHWIV